MAQAGASGAVGSGAADMAADPCQRERGEWDTACLRARYSGAPVDWPRPQIDAGLAWQEMAPAPAAPAPDAVSTLGERLFFDPRLSRKGQVACASCHQPDKAFGDGRPLAIGEDGLMGMRRSQTLLAAPFAPRLFWDGRAASLEQQAAMPIAHPREMNHTLPELVQRLAALPEYAPLFEAAYGRPQPEAAGITRALAAFVRRIRPAPTAFDDFLAGRRNALDDRQLLGLHLFRTKARCMHCHHGPLLTDLGFHNLNLSFFGRRNQDLGRFEFTRDPQDLGTFRTPSLRNVSRGGPWMHNGIMPSLEGIVRMYNLIEAGFPRRGGEGPQPPAPAPSSLLRSLQLTPEEITALAAFLEVL
ncbi:cytochrome-c peroxidase [Corticibacter populi]|uniref:Cytochrome-c peroxidase n=2 Tax=Corticibacter populi TaxID=1550736 RepID=A0A3M6QR93_9BURK|nr:cytochrome-c peroxidase [Corticibacter populi]